MKTHIIPEFRDQNSTKTQLAFTVESIKEQIHTKHNCVDAVKTVFTWAPWKKQQHKLYGAATQKHHEN